MNESEIKYTYLLLDFGGSPEDVMVMTEKEAKKENDKLLEGDRFLRWAKEWSHSALPTPGPTIPG